jgi:hypothetical protein
MKNQNKKCEVCGQEKHISEFSKSYPHRCKACVAEHTRMVRERAKQEQNRAEKTVNRTEMQKVVVKNTGETVLVRPCREPLNTRLQFYETEDGRKFPMFYLEFSKEIDWELRRYEIAKEMFQANFISNIMLHISNRKESILDIEELAEMSVRASDALITELQQGGAK